MADDYADDALSIYTGSRLPQSRGAWPTLPEFRPSARRVWERYHRPGDAFNPGTQPEMEDLAGELGRAAAHGDWGGAGLAAAGLGTGITQGKIRQGAKPKGQTKPNIPAWNFPEGYKPELQGGFGLKSLEALKKMREGNVKDDPVRVEYIMNELRKHGISDAEIEALRLPEFVKQFAASDHTPGSKRHQRRERAVQMDRALTPEYGPSQIGTPSPTKPALIRRSDIEKWVRENRPEIQHAYYQGQQGQDRAELAMRGPERVEGDNIVSTYVDPRTQRTYEMHRKSGTPTTYGVTGVKDVETGQWLQLPPPMRLDRGPGMQDAFEAMRKDIKQRTSTVPEGAVGGTRYAGGNFVLDPTAPHQEHAWGLGPNKEWAEAQAQHKRLYALKDAIVGRDWGGVPKAERDAATVRLREIDQEIAASDRRLSEINSGRYEAGHIRGPGNSAANQGAPWDYLTHSRVAPVEFQAQGTRVPGTLVEERQSDRYQQLRDRGARASPEAIAKAEEARNRAVKENQDAYEEARNWVSNVNPDVDWRTYGYGREADKYGAGDATMVSSRRETQDQIRDAIHYIHNETKPGTRAEDGTSPVQEAFRRLNDLKRLDEAESARHEELKAARSGVPGHPLINTAEAFNRFAAKTELLQAAKNAQEQGLPESASYWIAATPGPEQNARYGKSTQASALRLDDAGVAQRRAEYEKALLDPETMTRGPGGGMNKREWLKERLDEATAQLNKEGYGLHYRQWSPPGARPDRSTPNVAGWQPWDKRVDRAQLQELLGPDLTERLLATKLPPKVPYEAQFGHELTKLPGVEIGGAPFRRTYGDNAFTPGTVNDTLAAQLRKLDPATPEWTTANILKGSQPRKVGDADLNAYYEQNPNLVQAKRTPYGQTTPPPVAVRAHEMTPEARRKINEQGFSLFQLPIAAGIGASALAGSMLNQYGDPEDQQ